MSLYEIIRSFLFDDLAYEEPSAYVERRQALVDREIARQRLMRKHGYAVSDYERRVLWQARQDIATVSEACGYKVKKD